MKKIFALFFLLIFSASCVNIDGTQCSTPSEYNRNLAASYYNSFGTYKTKLTPEKAKRLFGCNYRQGDAIFSYNTFYKTKFILVRYGEALAFADDDE